MGAGQHADSVLERLRQDRALAVGLAVAAIWLLLCIGFAVFGPASDAPRTGWERVGTLAAVLTPLGLVAIATGIARSLAELRAEAEGLRAALGAMQRGAWRQADTDPMPADSGESHSKPSHPASPLPAASGLQPRPAEARRPLPAARPAATPRPAATRSAASRPAEPQPSLDLGGPSPVPVDTDDLIRALNFPDGPDDAIAVQALRAALRDPETARLIRAAQDMVMLLATRGLYMDDRPRVPDRPDLWRRLAEGVRGSALAGIIVPSDPEVLEMAASALRGDEVFRDAAHHFLRHWDRMLSRELPDLDNARVTALANTRSGRAFAILAEAAGSLD